jgi:predicted nucleic acid-binding protein
LKVLVDTSAWADFLNGHPTPELLAVRQLLWAREEICTCGVIVAEVFQGLRRDRTRDEIAALFRDLALLEPDGFDLYFRAAEIYRAMRERGYTVRSTIDCLIAALAEAHGAALLARDRDLSAILDSGLVEVERWPGPEAATPHGP